LTKNSFNWPTFFLNPKDRYIQIVTLFALVRFEKRKHMCFVTLVGFIFRMADGADLSVGYSNFNVFPYILGNEAREHANCIITPASVLPP
jgi:hypothetical protein